MFNERSLTGPCEGDNVFDCGPGDLCIPATYRCNWEINCNNGIDEISCGSAETTGTHCKLG